MPVDATYPPAVVQTRQDGNIHVPSGQLIDFETGSNLTFNDVALTATAAELNQLHGTTFTAAQLTQIAAAFGAINFDRGVKVARVALGALDTAGGIFAWVNPEAVSIVVSRVILDVTTVSSAACTLDIGTTATNATTLSDNLIDGLDVRTAAGVFGIADGADANGKYQQKLAAAKWVTGSKASGAAAGLVGFAYIFYTLI